MRRLVFDVAAASRMSPISRAATGRVGSPPSIFSVDTRLCGDVTLQKPSKTNKRLLARRHGIETSGKKSVLHDIETI